MTTDPDPDELLAGWHDVETIAGVVYPVLLYDVEALGPDPFSGARFVAVTEPCPWCGVQHRHVVGPDGDADGIRSPHCDTERPQREYVLRRRP